MKKIVLIFGGISGIIVAALMFLSMPYVMDGTIKSGQLLGYTTMVIALSVIFVAVKNYRDKYQNGVIKFGKAFLIGIYITLIAGFIYSASWEIYMTTHGINSQEFMQEYTQGQVDKMSKSGASAEQIQAVIEEGKAYAEMMNNPVLRFLFTMFFELFPVGLIISLICAGILRKKEILPAQVSSN